MSRRRPRVLGTRSRPPVTLYVLPEIPDHETSERKNAIAIRNACATEGRCPACGAVGEIHADSKHAGLFHFVFAHEDDCAVLLDDEANL